MIIMIQFVQLVIMMKYYYSFISLYVKIAVCANTVPKSSCYNL